MNEYRVKVSVRNNLLLTAIESAGFKTLASFAEECGISATELSLYVGLKRSPILSSGNFSNAAKAIMETLGAAPCELWTDRQLMMALESNSSERSASEDDIKHLIACHVESMTLPDPFSEVSAAEESRIINDALLKLSPRQAEILRMRNGINHEEMTLSQVAAVFGISADRVRQIEQGALRKLRHPKVFEELKCVGANCL